MAIFSFGLLEFCSLIRSTILLSSRFRCIFCMMIIRADVCDDEPLCGQFTSNRSVLFAAGSTIHPFSRRARDRTGIPTFPAIVVYSSGFSTMYTSLVLLVSRFDCVLTIDYAPVLKHLTSTFKATVLHNANCQRFVALAPA